jgi:hypothetical protein
MSMRHPLAIALVLALAYVSTSAGPVRDYPVTSILWGNGPDDTAHAIQSDGTGPYAHTAKGSSGVESHLQEMGGWELDVYYFTSSRRLAFNLPVPVPGSAVGAAPSGFIVAPARLITKCPLPGENLLQMTPTVPVYSCALDGRFDHNGKTYLIRMDPARFPGSTQPRITCRATNPANSNECRQWRIDTCAPEEGDACTPGVLTLAQESASKGKSTVVRVADYLVRFEIDIYR